MGRLAPYQVGAIATVACAVVAVVVLSWGRSEQADHTLVVTAWLVGVVGLLVAAGAIESVGALRSWRPTWQLAVAAAVVAVGFVLRIVQLDRFPRVVDADGMGFALVARDVADGRLRDPFSTGYLDHPALWSYAQRTVMSATGESLAGARTLSALVGTAAVAATIAWGRRLGGWTVGLVAGALLATSPMHLHFSRLALNNVTDSLALPLVLVLLDRAVVDHRRPAAAAAGLVLGLALYGYLGARVLVPIVALASIVLLVRARRHDELAIAGRLLGWVAAGALVAVAPLVVHYVEHPADLTARDDQVSIFAGWLDTEAATTGDPKLEILADQALDGLLLPVLAGRQMYHPPAPLVGWPLAIGAAIGLGVLISRLRTSRHAVVLAITWVVPLAAIATTVGLFSHRWVVGTPVVATTAAFGIVAVGQLLRAARPLPPSALAGAAAALVVVVGAVHAVGFFREENAIAQHGDPNSLVATELAGQLGTEPAGSTVVVAFAPRMSFRSHATVPFLADHVNAADLVDPLASGASVPDVPPGTLFVFLPERRGELVHVRARHPGGDEHSVTAFGFDLFTSYRIPG